MSEFTCDVCEETFETINDASWNSFKAAEEMLTLMPEAKNDPTGITCDDCFQEFLKWFKTLSHEEKEKIRKDFFNQQLSYVS